MPRGDSFIQEAFNQVCKEAKTAETWYVALMESAPFYGGPEEGGWWGRDTHLVALQAFPTEDTANAAKEQVEKLAQELTDQSRRNFGEQCLREMAWLEARGLDADFLPEPDGESEYFVVVSQGIPEEHRDSRQYC